MRAASIALFLLFTGCSSWAHGARPPVKTWELHHDDSYCVPQAAWCQGKSGLVRAQDKDVKDFKDADGYIAMTEQDLNQIISNCPAYQQ